MSELLYRCYAIPNIPIWYTSFVKYYLTQFEIVDIQCGGEVTYKRYVTRHLPYFDLESQLHIGKKTTRGCGEYWFRLG
jgi:hypothetical protein